MNSYANDFTHTVQTYYKELRKYKPIQKEIELELIKKAKKNNLKAKNEILTSNLRFVFDIAKHYKGNGVSIEDLISEGNLGLVKALDKFDVSKDVKFISYAVWWIRQSMQEVIKKRQNQTLHEINEDETQDCQTNKNFISDEEDDKYTKQENLLSDKDEREYNELNKQQRLIIKKLLTKIDKRAQYIIKEYYGLDGKEKTLEEIGNALNISKERVRQIKEKNLKILRSEILLANNFDELFYC